MSDDLVQQLAGLVNDMRHEERTSLDIARAVLACGLVVPTSNVLNLAQQWEDEHISGLDALMTGSDQYAAELRALTQQERA